MPLPEDPDRDEPEPDEPEPEPDDPEPEPEDPEPEPEDPEPDESEPDLVEPGPLFALRTEVAVPPVRAVVAVPPLVLGVVAVAPGLVPAVAPVVGVEPAVVSGPAELGVVAGPAELGVLSGAADVGVLSSPTPSWAPDELVVAPLGGSSSDEAAAKAPPAVRIPDTARAARAGVKRGRGIFGPPGGVGHPARRRPAGVATRTLVLGLPRRSRPRGAVVGTGPA